MSSKCTILGSSVFDNFLLDDVTCVSANNNLCGKLVSSLESPIKFYERFTILSELLVKNLKWI